MSAELALTGADKLVSALPRFVLKRYYTKARLDKEVRIDTRSSNPLTFVLSSYMPLVNAWFTVTNFTNLVWKIHDFTVQILIQNQPIAFAKCYDKPQEIRRKSSCDIFTTTLLNELQVARLKELKIAGRQAVAAICVYALFDSKIGLVSFNPTIPNRQPAIE